MEGSMLKSLISKKFPLLFKSDRERSEYIMRFAWKANVGADMNVYFLRNGLNEQAQTECFDVVHSHFGQNVLKASFCELEERRALMMSAFDFLAQYVDLYRVREDRRKLVLGVGEFGTEIRLGAG
jgi:hypothetical protein